MTPEQLHMLMEWVEAMSAYQAVCLEDDGDIDGSYSKAEKKARKAMFEAFWLDDNGMVKP